MSDQHAILCLIVDLFWHPENDEGIHMDLESDTGHLTKREVVTRAAIFFGWLIGLMVSMAAIGLIPSIPIFVILFMRVEAREKWHVVLAQALSLSLFVYFVFDRTLHIPWPPTLLGRAFPSLQWLPSV